MRSTLHRPGSPGRSESKGTASSGTGRRLGASRREPRHVHRITAAPRSRREDQNNRIRNYLISMSIRTICFALAGIFAVTTSWPLLAWICVIAAALLPYPAVVFANAVDRRRDSTVVQAPRRMIEGGPLPPTAANQPYREEPGARWYSG